MTYSVATALERPHYQHLIGEGFTEDQIEELEKLGVQSVSKAWALTHQYKIWDGNAYQSEGGLYFPFTNTFGQIRFNNPLQIPGKKPCKYLTPNGAKSQAYIPQGARVGTEGAKDALKPSLEGEPTIAVAGVSHVPRTMRQGCGVTWIFDSDGWRNPAVMGALLTAAIWCDGKVQLFPEMDEFPKGGACEFFKLGRSVDDYRELVAAAYWPEELIAEWMRRFKTYEVSHRSECAKVAAKFLRRLKHPDRYVALIRQRHQEQDAAKLKVVA